MRRHKSGPLDAKRISPHPARYPDEAWMKQIARNLTMAEYGFLNGKRFLIHDRDTKYCASFSMILRKAGIRALKLPARSPNLNAFAERWVRTVKEEYLSRFILLGLPMLQAVLKQYMDYYNTERNHQGLGNAIPNPCALAAKRTSKGWVTRRSRLGGLLSFYFRNPIMQEMKIAA